MSRYKTKEYRDYQRKYRRKWREKNPDKTLGSARKSMRKWRSENPEKDKIAAIKNWQKNGYKRNSKRLKERELLSDSYIKKLIAEQTAGILKEVPKEFIEIKKLHLKTKRLLKNLKTKKNDNNSNKLT